jgi:hypothetical protein
MPNSQGRSETCPLTGSSRSSGSPSLPCRSSVYFRLTISHPRTASPVLDWKWTAHLNNDGRRCVAQGVVWLAPTAPGPRSRFALAVCRFRRGSYSSAASCEPRSRRCSDLPHTPPVSDRGTTGWLCVDCLAKKLKDPQLLPPQSTTGTRPGSD